MYLTFIFLVGFSCVIARFALLVLCCVCVFFWMFWIGLGLCFVSVLVMMFNLWVFILFLLL